MMLLIFVFVCGEREGSFPFLPFFSSIANSNLVLSCGGGGLFA